MKWCDVLSLGPTPTGLTQDEWYDVRARFIADSHSLAFEDVRAELRAQDAALAKFGEHDAVIIWFEEDLFDQKYSRVALAVVRSVTLGRNPAPLICVNSCPGVKRFVGLGQSTPEELGTPYGTSEKVTAAQLALAREAWASWCSADPTTLERMMNGDASALPFLRAALLRHLEDFPSVRNGLSLTEQMALEGLSEGLQRARHQILRVADAARRQSSSPLQEKCDLLQLDTIPCFIDR